MSCNCSPGFFLCREAEQLWDCVVKKMRRYEDYSSELKLYNEHTDMKRTPFSTGEAISLSSLSGKISKRSSKAADRRLREELFTDNQGNHIDTCNCEECIREKEYYIALILASVVDEDTFESENIVKSSLSDNLDLFT